MTYDQPRFLPYPRPERAIDRVAIPHYASLGWITQFKMNGSASQIIVSPNGALTAFTRHAEPHKKWNWSLASSAPFQSLPRGWWVFCAELLHNKVVNGPKDTHYLHDILVANGERLIGKTYLQRYAILEKLFPPQVEHLGYYEVAPKLWLARNHDQGTGHAKHLFNSLEGKLEEGLVFKKPDAPLDLRGNNDWCVKCRLPHPNFNS